MTIQKSLLNAVNKLMPFGSASAHLDAEVLLSFILNKPKGYLMSHADKKLTPPQLNKFNSLIKKRQRNIPIPYLTKHKEFYGLDFYINEKVLVPRPETETLLEHTIKIARDLSGQLPNKQVLSICEIGTGSGCIAITLAKYLPQVKITATDISNDALLVAKKNAKDHKVLASIKFVRGDLLKPFIKKSKTKNTNLKSQISDHKSYTADLIVANLPYLTKDDLKNVRQEPKQALYGGKMGMEKIDKLISQSPRVLADNGVILLEISPVQVEAVRYVTEQHWPNKQLFFIKDLGERNRVAIIS